MGVDAYDVQVCIGKLLRFSSRICVAFLIEYPLVSFPLLCLFLLYMSFPSVFWFLLYSFPFLVFTAIILRIFFSIENGNEKKEDESGSTTSAENKRYLKHARSVRRRRAQHVDVEDNNNNNNGQCNLEEKNAVFSTSFNHDMVDKNALIEESPREIREIEVDSSSTNSITCEGPKRLTCLKRWEDEDQEESRKWNSGDQKSVMDVGLERTKRLESMIARRRARKLLSLQVRRTLMTMDRNDRTTANLSSLVIPKHDDTFIFSGNDSCQVSPVPGSAPSIMIPMRNPFDIPYDPHEEKPDLTGDSFQQEFMSANQNDVMFCRHESFSLGAFFPVQNKQNRLGETSSFQDFRFRQQSCSKEYQVSNPGHLFCKQKTCTCNETNETKATESESSQVIEPESISNSADDHIKEVIQVYENGNHSQEDIDREHEGSISGGNSNTEPSSSSSSEENEAYFKIDKGAILKSLSMTRRNNDIEAKENTDQIGHHLNYEAYMSDKNSLHDHFYYADKIVPRHTPSFSIASDMQVEVSEISSPPLTINENISSLGEDLSTYDVDMDKEITRCRHDSWEGSSHLSGVESESLSREVNEVSSEQDITEVEISRINEYEDSPVIESIGHREMVNVSAPPENTDNLEEIRHNEGVQGFVGITLFRFNSNGPQALNLTENLVVQQFPEIPSSSLSPNSVLQPSFSLDQSILSSADQENEEIQQSVAHNGELLSPVTSRNSTPMTEHSIALPPARADIEISQEPYEAPRMSTVEGENTTSVDDQETLELNGLNSISVASVSSHILSSDDEPAELLQPEETEFRSLDKNAEVLAKSIEAGHINHVDDGPNTSLSTEEELIEDQEKGAEEVITHSHSKTSRSYEDQRENSASENNTTEENHSNNFMDHI